MGIQGLLPLLKSIMRPIQIKELEGCSVAIDTYSWLHKGALSCSQDLCKGLPTSKHIDYCMHRVNLLRHNGVKPVLVFDGGLLPMKGDQENKRARSRKENLARAIEHESSGNAAAAYECYQKAVDISPAVAYELIQVLKQENIAYVVAPYEADAQMTFLAISKQVEAVITEDSDLIPFGCPRIIYKMDKFGQGVEFRSSLLQHNKELNFTGFTKQMLLEMCILSGCDYLQSLPGMGLKKAHALIKKFKSYDKVIKHLKCSGVAVLPLYEESFKKAIMTFQHQRVYDPVTEDIVHLSDPSADAEDDLDFLGPLIPERIAKDIARGEIDPFSKLPFQAESIGDRLLLDGTYKLKTYKAGGEKKKLDLPAQRNLLTNYFCSASLEAKRNFKAPRTSPKQPVLKSEFSSPQVDIEGEANICKMNWCPASLADLGNLDITPAKNSVDGIVSGKASVLLESPSHGENHDHAGETRNVHWSSQSILPCIALQKVRECSSDSYSGEGKTRIEKKKVIVRSSYFMKKPRKVNDLDKGDAYTGLCERPIPESECKLTLDVSDGNTIKETLGRSNMQHEEFMKGNDQGNKNIMELLDSDASESVTPQNRSMSPSDTVEGADILETRKVTVSSYFKHKSVKGSNKENKNEKLSEYGEFITDTSKNSNIESSPRACPNSFDSSIMKRKAPFVDTTDPGNLNHKFMRTGGYNVAPENPVIEPRAGDGKFGCNISHLGQYSDIAEKSIEKFAAVISSFRCTSSGSRASGLRAPLKDVRNTRTIRSRDSRDLSKFSYVPTKHKAPLLSHHHGR